MAVSSEYREYVLEQFGRVRPVTARPLFGGIGLYADGLIFGLLADDRTFLKVDDSNRADFEAEGMQPFVPRGGRPMKYFELPGELLEEPTALGPWLEKSIQVALDARRRNARAAPDG